eukprot:5653556-Pleurochrysis_carterae.AAC.1
MGLAPSACGAPGHREPHPTHHPSAGSYRGVHHCLLCHRWVHTHQARARVSVCPALISRAAPAVPTCTAIHLRRRARAGCAPPGTALAIVRAPAYLLSPRGITTRRPPHGAARVG